MPSAADCARLLFTMHEKQEGGFKEHTEAVCLSSVCSGHFFLFLATSGPFACKYPFWAAKKAPRILYNFQKFGLQKMGWLLLCTSYK